MVKHIFTIIDDYLSVDNQLGERVEITIPGTDIIIPDELAVDITNAINETKDAAITVINNNSIPTYTITINASNPIGNGTISFFLSDVAVLRTIYTNDITIASIRVNGITITLPYILTGNSIIDVVGNNTNSSQSITLTLSPLPSNRSIKLPYPAITSYKTYPIASGCWVPTESKIFFLGYTGGTYYGYIFDQLNSFVDTNLYNIQFYHTPVVYIPNINCIYIIHGSQIVPYYFATRSYGAPITLSGTIYSQAYNADDNILYIGTSAGLYMINPANNKLVKSITTYAQCTYLAYINNGTKLLVIARQNSTPNNPVILDAITLQTVATYDYVSGNIYVAQPCYHASTKRCYLAMLNNTTNGIGHIKILDLDPASPTYLQLIGTINNVYARWALLVGDKLYTCSSAGGSNSTLSMLSIPTHILTNISIPPSGSVSLIHHPADNAIYICSINGVVTIIPHNNG
jgi:hypothetical protein